MKKTALILLTCLALPLTAHAGPIRDIAILMDASGSVGSVGWNTEQEFVTSLIENVIPDYNSNFSIIQFATGASVEHSFSDNQTTSTVVSVVNSLPHTGGFTYTETALETAINEFDVFSDPSNLRSLIMITDGNPSSGQDPCSLTAELQNEGIGVFVFGVGSSLDFGSLDCLVDDVDTQMVAVDDFSLGSFDASVNSFAGFMNITDGSSYTTQAACETLGAVWADGACGSIWAEDVATSSVPEPPVWMLLSAGLLTLSRRRRVKEG